MKRGEFEFSRRKALAALGSIGAASAGAGLGTSAYLSDAETFENNGLTAGELDLGVGYTAHYSDWSPDEDGATTTPTADDVSVRMYDGPTGTTGTAADLAAGETGLPTGDSWLVAVDDPTQFLANTRGDVYPDAGDGTQDTISCDAIPQADDAEAPVVDLGDVKPGDFGTVALDFVLCDNPGYVWLNGTLRSASENGTTEPEADDPDEVQGVELLDAVQAAVWVDDGDGYPDGDDVLAIRGSLRTVLGELRTGPGLALGGNVDEGFGRNCFSHDSDGDGAADVHHVSLAWWLPVDHGNEVQSDSVTFDLGLYTEQCRHNAGGGVDIATIVERPEIQQLLTDLGHPSPSSPTADGFGSMGPVSLDFDQVQTRRLDDADDPSTPSVYRTVVPSSVGTLQFTSTESELVTPPAFVFDPDVPDTIRTRLDVASGIGWVDGTPAALIGNAGASVFFRPISPAERSRAEDTLDRSVEAGVGFDLAGEGLYVVPPSPDGPAGADTASLSASGPLVTDGGTTDCGALPGILCDPVATGETAVLNAGFDLVSSYDDDELAAQVDDETQCLADYVDCVSGRLGQGVTFAVYLAETCVRIAWAITSAFQNDLDDQIVIEVFTRLSPALGILLSSFAWVFLKICAIVSGVSVLVATSYFVDQCRVSALQCFGPRRSEPPSSLPSPTFETFVDGNADATVVSENLSAGGELDLEVYRCSTARTAIVYSDLDTTITVSFDYEIRRTDDFGEGPYFRVYEDGDVVAETGRNLSIIQPTAETTGRVTRTVDLDGDVVLDFGIEPSDYCGNLDHEDTSFTVSNLRVERGESTTPVSGVFETSTTGNADATVVSEDLSGGGELDFRVYKCNSAQVVAPLGNLDGTLSLSFDFESRRNDDFWELPYVRVVVDDTVVFDGQQELQLAPTRNDRGDFGNPRRGTVEESVPVDGRTTLVFGIEPSPPCSNFDHADTFFTVSNLSVGLE